MARRRSVREELEDALEVDELGRWSPSTGFGPAALAGTVAAFLMVVAAVVFGRTAAYAVVVCVSAALTVWGGVRYRRTSERMRRERSRRVRERLKRVEERGVPVVRAETRAEPRREPRA